MGLLRALGRQGIRQLRSGAMFGEPASGAWYRGGAAEGRNGMTFLTRNRDLARSFARDMHDSDEVAEVVPEVGRQQIIDWGGRPWNKGPSGLSTDWFARSARDEGYDSILLQNVESIPGMPADELVILRRL